MGRIREYIDVDGRKCWTLFDTGAKNTYFVPVTVHARLRGILNVREEGIR